MTRQYLRHYELAVFGSDGTSKIITDLRLKFEIIKSALSYPNKCNLQLYNANADTIAYFKKFNKIILNVGYVGNVRLLFKGDIKNVFPTRLGVDNVINVYCGDGQRDWENSTINKTFTANVSLKEVIKEITNSFEGLVLGDMSTLPDASDKLLGQTVSGTSKDVLDQYGDDYGFEWSIQDGEVIFTPYNKALTKYDAVIMNSVNGMIGSPTLTDFGVTVTTLLNPQILPHATFKIETPSVNVQMGNLYIRDLPKTSAEGLYKTMEVAFSGDTHDGSWISKVKGKPYNDN